jgi:hypothetical protein
LALEAFINGLPEERRTPVSALLTLLRDTLPAGFREHCDGRMVHFSVPHDLYPAGYHCNPKQPLPFISVASTKGHVALHHMGLYADQALQKAFLTDWTRAALGKPDMGKGCVRFKRMDRLDAALPVLGDTFARMTPEAWIACYEAAFKR